LVLWDLGRRKEARAAFKQANELDPTLKTAGTSWVRSFVSWIRRR
jgi:hypothetical protein